MPVSGRGGTETVLTKVLNHLAKEKDYNIVLYLTQQPTNIWLNSFNKSIEIHMCDNNKVKKLLYFTKIFTQADNNDHFIILGANIIPFANKIRKIFHKKYLITSWIHYSLVGQDLFEPKNLLQADDHWAISSSIKDTLIKLGVEPERIHLILNPIERNKDTIALNKDKTTTKLVYVGRLELNKQKNLHELLSFVNKNNNITVDLFGKLDKKHDENPKNFYPNTDKIHYHKWTANPWAEISKLKPNALILTSKFEGLPMVALEAISRGIPCLLANFKGSEDVIQSKVNGYIFEHNNQDLLAKTKLLNTTTWNQNTIKNSIDKFYFNQYFERLNKVLKQY